MSNTREMTEPMTPEEKAFIDSFVTAYCRPHADVLAQRLARFAETHRNRFLRAAAPSFALAAGPRTAVPETVHAPDEEVRFVFASEGDAAARDAWRAELTIPPRATLETRLVLSVHAGDGTPAEGLFTLSGCVLPLKGGRAEIPFGLFLTGIEKTDVSLQRPGTNVRTGRLLFF